MGIEMTTVGDYDFWNDDNFLPVIPLVYADKIGVIHTINLSGKDLDMILEKGEENGNHEK